MRQNHIDQMTMEGSEALRVLMCPISDEGTQKCHLGPNLFKTNGLKLGQCITIAQNNRKYVCKAWIRKDKHDTFIDFDRSVHDGQVTSPAASHHQGAHIYLSDIKPQAVSNFKQVEVKLIMHRCKDVFEMKQNQNIGCIKDFLKGRVFSQGCVIENQDAATNGIYCVIIKETAPCKTVYGSVTETSTIVLQKIVSKERYMLDNKVCPPLGGLSKEHSQLKQMIEVPLLQGETVKKLGLSCPKSVLLRGPPGCGKTTLVKFTARKSGAILVSVTGAEVIGSRPGETEQALRQLFEKVKLYSQEGPTVLFFDELDSFCGKKNRDTKVLSQLCQILDQVQMVNNLVVIGATNRPSALDSALRRPGRFDREIFIGIPPQSQRQEILETLSGSLPLDSSANVVKLAEATPGFVGADLKSLLQQSYYTALERVRHTEVPLKITQEDLEAALHLVVPSTQRSSDVLVDTKPIHWCDIGGLESVKAQVKQAIELPLTHPEAFSRLGLPRPKGVLLYGPPGCAKTTLVRAAATACHVTFLSISGAQLYSPFVGDSERKISEVFQQARAGAPSILFIDEIDSVVGSRSKGSVKQGGVQERVLSTLLNEMDGIGLKVDTLQRSGHREMLAEGEKSEKEHDKTPVSNHDVLVVAATNRPDMLDDALLRPGRIDKIIYVPTPDTQAREEILKVHSRQMATDGKLDLKSIAEQTEYFSGADLENLCREAALHALSVDGLDVAEVTQEHFMHVVKTATPSLSKEQLKQYQELKFT